MKTYLENFKTKTGQSIVPEIAYLRATTLKLLWTVVYTVLGITSSVAQIQKINKADFMVSTKRSLVEENAAIAVSPNGSYIMVWQTFDGSGKGIYAQRYDAAGDLIGNEFQVNSAVQSNQTHPDIATDKDGNFVVVWEHYDDNINARRYNAAGEPLGKVFTVNTDDDLNHSRPVVAMSEGGGFVVTWHGIVDSPFEHLDIFARVYDEEGSAKGPAFVVNSGLSSDEKLPAIAIDAVGNFVISWQSNNSQSLSESIYARRYYSTGVAQDNEFIVKQEFGIRECKRSSVAMDQYSGRFAITWSETNDEIGESDILVKRYNSSGEVQGDEFRANTTTTGSQDESSIVMSGNGENFAIIWSGLASGASSDNNKNNFAIYAQRYSQSTGDPIGEEVKVSGNETIDLYDPALGLDHEGDLVMAWTSTEVGSSGFYIYGTQYEISRAPSLLPILDREIQENSQLVIQIKTEDKNTKEKFQYTLDNDSQDLGMKIEKQGNEAQLVWTPDTRQAGTYQVKIKVEDQGGLSDEISFVLLVTDLAEAPVIIALDDQEILIAEPFTLQVEATDGNNDVLTYGLDLASMNLGMTLDQQSGVFSWTPKKDQVGTYEVTVRVADKTLDAKETFRLKVIDPSVLSVEDARHASLLIYPNPATASLQLSSYERSPMETYIINDLTGHEVQTGSLSKSSFKIPVESLSKGTYMLTVHGKDWVETQRFVKSN